MADLTFYIRLVTIVTYLTALKAQNLDCDFEAGFCDWQTDPSSYRNWTRSNVKSGTPMTGPDSGHTSQQNNYYIYLYAANFKQNDGTVAPGNKCILNSPDFNTSSDGGCFQFWFYMKGTGVGNLSVIAKEGVNTLKSVHRSGEQGGEWKCGKVTMGTDKTNITITITATSGLNVLGDIALDDFKYYSKQCDQVPQVCMTSMSSTVTDMTSTTPITSATRTQSSTTVTTVKTAETTTVEPPDDTWILYVAIVPIGILLLGAVIACAVYKLKKKPKKEFFEPNWTASPEDDNNSVKSEYAELDEVAMNIDAVDDGYTIPAENGITSPENNNNQVKNGSVSKYLRMKTLSKPKDEDTSSECSYVETVPAPIGSAPQPAPTGNASASFPTGSTYPPAGPGRSDDGMMARARQSYSNDRSRSGVSNQGFLPEESRAGLSVEQRVTGRASPVPDYDYGAPPPACGPTIGYIRPFYKS